MPYRRRYKAPSRSYSRRKRRVYSRRRGSHRLRGAASNLRRGGRLGIETKYSDGGVEGSGIGAIVSTGTLAQQGNRIDVGGANTSATGNLWIIPQGDGPSQRDGSKITILSMIVRGAISFPHSFNTTVAVTDNLSTAVHIFIVLDTQSNGAGCLLSDVFTFPTTDGSTAFTSLYPLGDTPSFLQRNMTWGKRFVVLKHMVKQRRWALSDTPDTSIAVDSSPSCIVPFKWVKKCRMRCTYNVTNTDGQMSGIQDNSVHIFVVDGTTAGSFPKVSYTARVRFRG